MSELHEYLRVCSGLTAKHMWRDLLRSRRLKIMWDGVPATEEAFNAGLDALLASGLAEKTSGGLWLWIPKPVEVKPVKQRQESLFA